MADLKGQAQALKDLIQQHTQIPSASLLCGIDEGKLVVRIPKTRLPNEIQVPEGVQIIDTGQVVRLSSTDMKKLATTAIGAINSKI